MPRTKQARKTKPEEATSTQCSTLAALDGDAESFHVAQRAEFGDADFYPRRLEFAHDDFSNRYTRLLQQRVVLRLEQLLDAPDYLAVIDGVADLAALSCVCAGQADFEIELYRLRRLLFPLVDADPGVYPEFVDENNVHVNSVKGEG